MREPVPSALFTIFAILLIIIYAGLSSGCAAIEPQRINLEMQHTSHVSQHFVDHTEYGYDSVGVDAHWQYGRVGIDVSEGAVLGYCGVNYCEGLYGPRDVFNARVDYSLWSKP